MNQQPTFQSHNAFTIVGVERYTANGISDIRDAWDVFSKRSQEIIHVASPRVVYGFEDYSRDFVLNQPGFPKYYYIASLGVDRTEDIPEGMIVKNVPQANYAVFTYHGNIDGLPEFFRYIYDEWLPTSGYQLDPKVMADFERYTEPMTDPNNMTVEIWVAVAKKTTP